MGDIITTFANIGEIYQEDEKRVKNKAYEYDEIKVYLFDTVSKNITPSTNINKDDLIITRFGVGANSGNLFPNVPFEPKEINKDFDKFVRGIIKANKNLLSYFSEEEIEKSEILKILNSMNESFFEDRKEQIQTLEKYKQKGKKCATYFALSFDEKPISVYFKEIFEKHLNKTSQASKKGYDILTNKEGIGGDANLAFCSVNELPTKLKGIKYRLLPLSFESAKKVKVGFEAVDKIFSHNFYGLKLAIIPTLLNNDKDTFKMILKIFERVKKGDIQKIKEGEVVINLELENIAIEEEKEQIPVLNTILFYNKSNAAVDVLLQIDDILPSYISFVAKNLSQQNIKAFKNKDIKDSQETIYLQNIFEDRLEIMNILLSSKKIDKDILIEKFFELIYYGSVNKSYGYRVDWSKYFNGYYYNRSIEAIERYITLFNALEKLKQKIRLKKECDVQEVENIEDKSQKIKFLLENSEFLEDDVLKTAYLLGMLSSAIISWQYAISGSDSYNRWLNNIGAITKDTLPRIWKKAEESIRKLNSTSKSSNHTINTIKDLTLIYAPKAFNSDKVVKGAYVSLAFAMGGSDFNKLKEKKENENA